MNSPNKETERLYRVKVLDSYTANPGSISKPHIVPQVPPKVIPEHKARVSPE